MTKAVGSAPTTIDRPPAAPHPRHRPPPRAARARGPSPARSCRSRSVAPGTNSGRSAGESQPSSHSTTARTTGSRVRLNRFICAPLAKTDSGLASHPTRSWTSIQFGVCQVNHVPTSAHSSQSLVVPSWHPLAAVHPTPFAEASQRSTVLRSRHALCHASRTTLEQAWTLPPSRADARAESRSEAWAPRQLRRSAGQTRADGGVASQHSVGAVENSVPGGLRCADPLLERRTSSSWMKMPPTGAASACVPNSLPKHSYNRSSHRVRAPAEAGHVLRVSRGANHSTEYSGPLRRIGIFYPQVAANTTRACQNISARFRLRVFR